MLLGVKQLFTSSVTLKALKYLLSLLKLVALPFEPFYNDDYFKMICSFLMLVINYVFTLGVSYLPQNIIIKLYNS